MKWVPYIHGEAADIKEQMIANEKSYEDINCTGRGICFNASILRVRSEHSK